MPKGNRAHPFETLYQSAEAALRAADFDQVSRHLKALTSAKVPRLWRLPFARLGRRINALPIAIKLLFPVIYGSGNKRNELPPTSEELVEYAACLQRIGAVGEALELLDQVDAEKTPTCLLFKAYCQMNLWNYDQATEDLTGFLERNREPYLQQVGYVNLAASMAAQERYDESLELLKTLNANLEGEAFRLLQSNCLEIKAQIHVAKDELEQAEECLNQASQYLECAAGLDLLFVAKWKAVIESLRSHSPVALLTFRALAESRNEPEAVRDSDFYLLKIQFDAQKFEFLYRGTPHPNYRRRLLTEFRTASIGNNYRLHPLGKRQLKLQDGTLDGKPFLKVGSKPYLLLKTLFRDFYRSVSAAEIHAAVFPNEHYDVNSSNIKIRQIIFRTKALLKTAKVPIQISTFEGGIKATVDEELCVEVVAVSAATKPYSAQLRQALNSYQNEVGFSAAEACVALGQSIKETHANLTKAIEAGEIRRYGSARATIYFFA